ncbi:MAG: alpha/beta hydrolase [Atopobiaceae bacterium]
MARRPAVCLAFVPSSLDAPAPRASPRRISRAKYFYDRGIPVITFQGPGQGTSLYYKQMWLTEDNFIDAVRAVINYVRSNDRIGDTVVLYGISYGISYGGFLAMQAACALNDDICGLIVRGGTDKTDTLTRHPWAGQEDFYLHGFLHKLNVDTLEECSRLSAAQDVTDQLYKITKPLLNVHSKEDPILGVEGAKRIFELSSSEDKYYAEYNTNSHTVNDMDDTASAFAADWMKLLMVTAARAAKHAQ